MGVWVEGEEASGFDGVQVCFCLASHVIAKLHIYFLINPEGVVIKNIALQEIGTPSVRLSVRLSVCPTRIVFQDTNAVWLNVAFSERP